MTVSFSIKNISLVLLFLCLCACGAKNQIAKEGTYALVETVDQRFRHAAEQYKLLKEELPDGRFPKTYNVKTNKVETSGPDWWVSGFYPGTLLYLFEETRDSVLWNEANRAMKILAKQQNNQKTADLGFILYSSFGNALKIAPDIHDQKVLLTAAKTLMKRYDPKMKAIRSWDTRHNDEDFVIVIDHLMNLPLLFWATAATGDSTYYKAAVNHAETVSKHFFRPDYSVYQVVTLDAKKGNVKEKRNAQAYNDTTTWSRGEAWALYGFTALYRETKSEKYLSKARHIADFILDHPNLPKDKVPYWDFNAPDIPHTYRDASAGAIIASALLELCGFGTEAEGKKYFRAAEQLLETLASPEYTALLAANGGFILKHGAGYIPVLAEVDVPLPYADYYYIEALKRFKMISGQGKSRNASLL